MRRLTRRLGRVLMGGLVAALAALPSARAQEGGELTMMTSVALTSALDALKPNVERQDNLKLAMTYGLIADLKKRVLGGESADVIILSQPAMEDLAKESKIVASSLVPVAITEIGVAVRAGAPKPDISTVDTFKQALLAAKSIVYADPAKGGASGVYFARVADRLGIADQLKGKTILVPGAQAADVVAKGEAELGIGQLSEIVPVAGAQLVGPFPAELANKLVFMGAIGAGAKSPDAAKAFFQFLARPDAKALLKSKGFEPGNRIDSREGAVTRSLIAVAAASVASAGLLVAAMSSFAQQVPGNCKYGLEPGGGAARCADPTDPNSYLYYRSQKTSAIVPGQSYYAYADVPTVDAKGKPVADQSGRQQTEGVCVVWQKGWELTTLYVPLEAEGVLRWYTGFGYKIDLQHRVATFDEFAAPWIEDRADGSRKRVGPDQPVPDLKITAPLTTERPPGCSDRWVKIWTQHQEIASHGYPAMAAPPGSSPNSTRSPSGRCWYFQREVWGPYGFVTCQ